MNARINREKICQATLAWLPTAAAVAVTVLLVVGLPHLTQATTIDDPVFSPLGNFQREGRDYGLQVIIGRAIRGIIAVSGVAALAMFVWSGFRWMTAQGNKDTVAKAQQTLIWSVLGLIMIFGSYALVSFVLGTLGQ
ncbi:MAG: pilin [bacterium]